MKNKKIAIYPFAVFASVLMLMTIFVQPVTAEVGDQLELIDNYQKISKIQEFANALSTDSILISKAKTLDRYATYYPSLDVTQTYTYDSAINLLNSKYETQMDELLVMIDDFSENPELAIDLINDFYAVYPEYCLQPESDPSSQEYEIGGALPLYPVSSGETIDDGDSYSIVSSTTCSYVPLSGTGTIDSSTSYSTVSTVRTTPSIDSTISKEVSLTGDSITLPSEDECAADWAGFMHNMNGEIYIPGLGWVPESEYGWLEDLINNGLDLQDLLGMLSEILLFGGLLLVLAFEYGFFPLSLTLLTFAALFQTAGFTGPITEYIITLANNIYNFGFNLAIIGAFMTVIGVLLSEFLDQ